MSHLHCSDHPFDFVIVNNPLQSNNIRCVRPLARSPLSLCLVQCFLITPNSKWFTNTHTHTPQVRIMYRFFQLLFCFFFLLEYIFCSVLFCMFYIGNYSWVIFKLRVSNGNLFYIWFFFLLCIPLFHGGKSMLMISTVPNKKKIRWIMSACWKIKL